MDYEMEILIVERYFLPDGVSGYCKEAAEKMATKLRETMYTRGTEGGFYWRYYRCVGY